MPADQMCSFRLLVLDLLNDGPDPAFDTWLDRKLNGIALAPGREVEDWIRGLHDGGRRTRPCDPHT
ncbi:hypothetical protein AB0M12_38715 [Nocardia vinacea]|uniref:hypothetical protein n=1 Tax=Nocardia vinacea TaxID=96468 RepID=UPI003433EA38